jgi:hypothetical protein
VAGLIETISAAIVPAPVNLAVITPPYESGESCETEMPVIPGSPDFFYNGKSLIENFAVSTREPSRGNIF